VSKINNKNKSNEMLKIIHEIRNCNQGCYLDRYVHSLNTRVNGQIRKISIQELRQGRPLIDDWRNQSVLLISQAPSKQAWVDHKLSSLENSFFSEFLLPRIFPGETVTEAIEKWKQTVFWIHTANCYPFARKVKNRWRDKLPNLICANKYMSRIVNVFKPELIILMSRSSTQFFACSIKKLIKSNSKSYYPSLNSIIEWQFENKSMLTIYPKNEDTQYFAIAVPHAVNWHDLNEKERYVYEQIIMDP
jgi:hypothetical protein